MRTWARAQLWEAGDPLADETGPITDDMLTLRMLDRVGELIAAKR